MATPRTADKASAERILAKRVAGAALRRDGVIDARTDSYVVAAKRPLTEHVEDWRASLAAKGATPQYVAMSVTRVRAVLTGTDATHWPSLDATRVAGFLAEQRERGMSVETSNHYLRRVKQFARWMVTTRRAIDNPLACLSIQNSRPHVRHERRPLSPDELRELLATATTAPTWRNMTGSDRAMLYRAAVETGLRANELRTLTVGSFDLDDNPPTVTVAAAYSKHRRADTLPLRTATATTLARWLGGADRSALAFPTMPEKTAEMIRQDLRRARARWIRAVADRANRRERRDSEFLATVDGDGRVVDFHALRHTFITNLARGGVHPKLAQALARHSTITLTMDRYTHTVIGEQADALSSLPDLSPATPERQPMRATGTCDENVGVQPTQLSTQLTRGTYPKRSEHGDERSMGATSCHPRKTPGNKGKSGITRNKAAACVNEGGRTRTYDKRLKRPLLYRLSYAPHPRRIMRGSGLSVKAAGTRFAVLARFARSGCCLGALGRATLGTRRNGFV